MIQDIRRRLGNTYQLVRSDHLEYDTRYKK